MIRPLAELCPSFKHHVLDFPVQTDFFLIGGSVTTFARRLVGAFWASNMYYEASIAKYLPHVAPPGTPFRPGRAASHRPPYLVTFDDNLLVQKVEDITFATSNDPRMEKFRTSPAGFDGPKPFEWRGELWMDFYAGREGRDLNFFLSRLDGAQIVEVRPLAPLGVRRGDEKNWMPETDGNMGLRYHYRLGKLIDIGGAENIVGRQDFSGVNGGTQVIPFEGGGLAIVHDFHFGQRTPGRKYRHYFVKFDSRGAPLALSTPFVMVDVEKVEVVTGLALHPDRARVVIAHGPFLDVVSLDDIRALPWDGVPQAAASPHRARSPRVRPIIQSPRARLANHIIHPGVKA